MFYRNTNVKGNDIIPSVLSTGVSASKIPKRAEIPPNKGGPFAAALRTLAKNAGPDAKDGESTRSLLPWTKRFWKMLINIINK